MQLGMMPFPTPFLFQAWRMAAFFAFFKVAHLSDWLSSHSRLQLRQPSPLPPLKHSLLECGPRSQLIVHFSQQTFVGLWQIWSNSYFWCCQELNPDYVLHGGKVLWRHYYQDTQPLALFSVLCNVFTHDTLHKSGHLISFLEHNPVLCLHSSMR